MTVLHASIKASSRNDRFERSPVAEQSVELDDGLLLLQAELAPLDVRPEVVRPPEAAALAAPLQPCHTAISACMSRRSQRKPNSVAEMLLSLRLLTTLASNSELTGFGGQRAPAAVAVLLNVGEQLLVLLRRPRALLEPLLVAARRSPHRPH
jgi:hypothetical protein